MPATRALHKDMARPVTYGTVSAAMETSTQTIIATPHVLYLTSGSEEL
jgi:hypothetical protein